MHDHNPQDDAHKAARRDSDPEPRMKVIVDLSTVGIPPARVNKILECVNTNRYFILHNDKALIQYWPGKLFAEYKNTHGEIQEFIFPDIYKLVDSIKLNLLILTDLLIPAMPVEDRGHKKRLK